MIKLKHNLLKITFLFLLNTHSVFLFGQENLRVKAEKGDGVFSLLKKYDLHSSNCNRVHFYELNNLEEGDGLLSMSCLFSFMFTTARVFVRPLA